MRKRDGFTLVEASVAMSIFVIGIAMILGGYMYLQKNSQEQLIQDELEMDLNMAVQRLQAEMRLSSLHKMTYYPASSRRYTAVSFPLLNQDGEWGRTVIYHTYGEGDEQRLLRTEFDSFLPSLADRQTQLATVVRDGNGSNAENGANAKTTTLFQHVLDWSIIPQAISYNGYSDSVQRDLQASLGFGIVDPGENTITFTVTGKDDRSGGYKIGLDTLRASASRLLWEAEDQSVSGSLEPTVVDGELWSGYNQLLFNATTTGQTFTISFYNDGWLDTNFDSRGNIKSNVTVGLQETSYDHDRRDLVLHLDGDTINWRASSQTGDEIGIGIGSGVDFKGAALRTIIRESSMGKLRYADQCRVAFSAGSNDLHIVEAHIDEVIDSDDVVPDTVGNSAQILFYSGSKSCVIPEGTTVWSDDLDFPIKYDKSYAVTFLVANNEDCKPKSWEDQNGVTGTYVIENTLSNTVSSVDLVLANWSARAEVKPLNETVAVEMLYMPSIGTYVSPVVDTQMESPEYNKIDWTADCPDETSVSIKVRSGSDPEMSDAPAWSEVLPEASSGAPSLISKRFVQYQAVLSSDGFDEPKLRDVTLEWLGETKMVEVGGIFVNGPDYGQFEVTVDGQPLTSPLRVSLVVREEIRTMNNKTKTVEATEGFELAPRNTGK